MEAILFEQIMNSIVFNIQTAGYDPCDQLTGYIQTGDASYITRNGDARQVIQTLDMEQIKSYFEKHVHK